MPSLGLYFFLLQRETPYYCKSSRHSGNSGVEDQFSCHVHKVYFSYIFTNFLLSWWNTSISCHVGSQSTFMSPNPFRQFPGWLRWVEHKDAFTLFLKILPLLSTSCKLPAAFSVNAKNCWSVTLLTATWENWKVWTFFLAYVLRGVLW